MRGHDQSPIRNDTDYIVLPPEKEVDETTDNPEKHNASTFKGDIEAACKAIAKHLNLREVDPWFQGVVAAIDRTSAVWTLSKCDGEYLAIVEGNPMFPSPRSIRRAKTFSLALAWAFLDWLEQREQD